ncbi:hypothetical protein EDD22DRAFT_1051724 [Suillus occidentalis]|nr:hypothetical protein EDD22DRAFT_1051724 [Suillus occidentalis]
MYRTRLQGTRVKGAVSLPEFRKLMQQFLDEWSADFHPNSILLSPPLTAFLPQPMRRRHSHVPRKDEVYRVEGRCEGAYKARSQAPWNFGNGLLENDRPFSFACVLGGEDISKVDGILIYLIDPVAVVLLASARSDAWTSEQNFRFVDFILVKSVQGKARSTIPRPVTYESQPPTVPIIRYIPGTPLKIIAVPGDLYSGSAYALRDNSVRSLHLAFQSLAFPVTPETYCLC